MGTYVSKGPETTPVIQIEGLTVVGERRRGKPVTTLGEVARKDMALRGVTESMTLNKAMTKNILTMVTPSRWVFETLILRISIFSQNHFLTHHICR